MYTIPGPARPWRILPGEVAHYVKALENAVDEQMSNLLKEQNATGRKVEGVDYSTTDMNVNNGATDVDAAPNKGDQIQQSEVAEDSGAPEVVVQ